MRSATRRPVNYATLVSLDLLHAMHDCPARVRAIVVHEVFFLSISLPLSQSELFSDRSAAGAPKEGHQGPPKNNVHAWIGYDWGGDQCKMSSYNPDL